MKTRFYQIMAVSALCLAAAALAVALWTSAQAQEEAPQAALAIPTTLNYQGYLREPDGSLTTGTHDITANIYSDTTGGSSLYTTTLPGVTVRDGLFNIVLGDNPALPADLFANAPLYIGISLNSDPELVPRQRLHSVPWAFQASTLVNNATIQGLTSNGNVAVNGDLTVTGGDLTVTGNIAHPGETFIGPHFLASPTNFKPWGACPLMSWTSVDSQVPDGATAVILQYAATEGRDTEDTHISIRKESGAASYDLAYMGGVGGGVYSSAGQGIFPITEDGTFEWMVDDNMTYCAVSVIGYFK